MKAARSDIDRRLTDLLDGHAREAWAGKSTKVANNVVDTFPRERTEVVEVGLRYFLVCRDVDFAFHVFVILKA
jgi:hypothetical protein